MAQCIRCSTETQLYDCEVPICPKCLEVKAEGMAQPLTFDQIRTILAGSIIKATNCLSDANQEFNAAMTMIPSGLPHPDGVQRIKNASRALKMARDELAKAHHKIENFLNRGIVPEDLNRGR